MSRVVGATALLLLCAIGVSAYYAIRRAPAEGVHLATLSYLVIVPASAALLFMAIGIATPSLFAVRRFEFPLNLTLPLVYGVILRLCAVLWSRGPSPIVRIPFLEQVTHFWQSPKVAIALAILQCMLLSLAILARAAARRASGA